ncbi:hypothetical protein [Pseudomonas sp. DC3000-4b1]|uniref:hypothetical protein n=1 Tax=unclassified Pseudomonas TaxID=196821 RepID=UPI003CF89E03
MTIRLELFTEDPEEVAFIRRYWAMDDSGAFLEKVSDLLPFKDIPQSGAIAAYVRERCKAYDENQPCVECGDPIEIGSRSEARKQPPHSSRRCECCQQLANNLKRQRDAEMAAALDARLAEHAREQDAHSYDYAAIKDDEALILLALEAAITPRLASGSFILADCEALAPSSPSPFIKRLWTTGILIDLPLEAPPGAYFLKGDELWFERDNVVYALAPDKHGQDAAQWLETLCTRSFSDGAALTELWLDYAVQDVMNYFRSECLTYNHLLEEEELGQVESSFRHALRTYSVAQLWSVAWRAVRDAASLASRTYYNRYKAAATLPGKVRRLLEKAEREGMVLRAWSRREEQPAGTLGMVFWALFEIDEDTPGAEALSRFARLADDPEPTATSLREPASQLLTTALAQDKAAEVLMALAVSLQAGEHLASTIASLLLRLESDHSGIEPAS